MSAMSDRFSEQRRVIDVNTIRGDLVGAQFKNVGEWNADHRAIVARVSNFSLADCGPCPVPRAAQPVSARRDRRKKRRHRCVDGFVADDYRSIAEPKLRIRSEELNEAVSVAPVDNREHLLPPRWVGLHHTIGRDDNLIHSLEHTPRRANALIRG